MKRLVVNNYSAQWLGKGFSWVYPKELESKPAQVGQTVELVDKKGKVLGIGVADKGFLAARVFRFDPGPMDQDLFSGLLDRSLDLRQEMFQEKTNCFRVVNGENDGLPGIRIDWWSHIAVIILDSVSLERLLPMLTHWLNKRMNPRGIVLAHRRDPREEATGDARTKAVVIEGRIPPGAVPVLERGIKLLTWPAEAPDVGVYCDMRGVRQWLEPYWGGTTVLNLFSFTGAFSVAAAKHGAVYVMTSDLSDKYLNRAEQNFLANDIDVDMHDFIQGDAFKILDRLRRKEERFNRVVVDPPSFSHSDEGTWSAQRDWPRLVAGAARVTESGGWLILASNQGALSPKKFDGFIADGLRKAGRSAQLLTTLGQAYDFPAATYFPEGRYLKVRVLRLS